jgi:hypothetical protein
MSVYTETAASVNWSRDNRRHYAEYATGAQLYRENKPVAACANNTQRQGYRDAESGDMAARLVKSMTAQGISYSAAVESMVV